MKEIQINSIYNNRTITKVLVSVNKLVSLAFLKLINHFEPWICSF
jgi:hypothetical protein